MNKTFAYKTFLIGILIIALAVMFKELYRDTDKEGGGFSKIFQAIPEKTPVTRSEPVQETVQPVTESPGTEVFDPLVNELKLPAVKSQYTKEWKGLYSGLDQKVRRVIRDQSDWEKQWDQFISNREQSLLLPTIDFSRYMVIILGMGDQPGDGYGITISSIAFNKKKMIIYYSEAKPAFARQNSSIPSQPYHIKVIPANPHQAVFKKVP